VAKKKQQRISVEDFLIKMEWEGGPEAILDYYSDDDLASLEDAHLSALALTAKKALAPFLAYVEELQENQEGDDDEEED
jgi:hypothetical protein